MQVNKPTDLNRLGAAPRADAVTPSTASAESATPVSPAAPVDPVRRADEVELSIEGRALSAAADTHASLVAELGEARVYTIRENVDSGAYLTSEHAGYVARAMLARGDF